MALAMAGALLAVPGGSAVGAEPCPSDEACVVVTVVGDGEPVTSEFSISDFERAPDIRERQSYSYRGSGSVLLTVLPVRDLLEQLGTPSTAVTFVELDSSTAAPRSTLSTAAGDLDDPGPFDGGLLPAIYTANGSDGTRFGYTRGQRGSSDDNGADTIITPGDLLLTVHTKGRALTPVVTASPASQTTTNRPVTLGVDVEDAPGLRYDWSFGDGTTLKDSTDATPTHQYTRTTTAGQDSFTASVTVSGSDSSIGSSRPVTITIGSPTIGDGTKPGTGSDAGADQGAPATGPDRSRGDTQGAKPSSGSGGTGSGSPGTGSGAGTGSGSPAPAGGAPQQAPEPGDTPLASDLPEAFIPSDGLVDVSGTLLGEVDATGRIVPTPEQQAAAERTAAAARESAARPYGWGPLVGVLGLLALVGLGALSETTWLRRRLEAVGRR